MIRLENWTLKPSGKVRGRFRKGSERVQGRLREVQGRFKDSKIQRFLNLYNLMTHKNFAVLRTDRADQSTHDNFRKRKAV